MLINCGTSSEVVIAVWHAFVGLIFLVFREVKEMLGPMHLVIKFFRGVHHQTKLHVLAEVDAVEVVIPGAAILRNHEVA